jgi:hypothetical protein
MCLAGRVSWSEGRTGRRTDAEGKRQGASYQCNWGYRLAVSELYIGRHNKHRGWRKLRRGYGVVV